jgi:hypothetical protein
MKTTSTTTTTLLSILLLTIALSPSRLLAQETRINRTGEVQTNTTFQDFEGAFNQTISLKFGAKPAQLTLPVGSAAALTLPEVATYIGIMNDEFDLSSYIGIMGDEFDLSSHAKIPPARREAFCHTGHRSRRGKPAL